MDRLTSLSRPYPATADVETWLAAIVDISSTISTGSYVTFGETGAEVDVTIVLDRFGVLVVRDSL